MPRQGQGSAFLRLLAAGVLLAMAPAADGAPAPRPRPSESASSGLPASSRILLVGLDGADWQIAGPLIDAGRLPHLARLRREGAWGDLRSTTPMLSPLLWTSLATGKSPAEHGVIDFLVVDPRTGNKVPIASTFRKSKALWNILSENGRSTDFIGWWATWPAETVNGHIVSDRFAYSLFGYRSRPEDTIGLVSPPDFLRRADRLRVTEESITLADMRRFVEVTGQDLAAARARIAADPAQGYADPIGHLVRILASTRTYHAIALALLKEGRRDLVSIYYQGIDEMGHRFGHYLPPRLPWVDEEKQRKYARAVTRFYEYQDELLGELLAAAGPDTITVIVSDHGFLNGSDRPDSPPDNEKKAGLWHRLYGILVMHGPGIRPGRLDTPSLYDVTPTLLHLAGLPVAADMQGKPILEAIEPAFRKAGGLSTLPTYETPGTAGGTAPAAGSSAAIDEEILARLRSLGYIAASDIATGGPAGAAEAPATVTNLINTASLQLAESQFGDAETTLREVLRRAPDHAASHSALSEALEGQGRFEEAAQEARTALNLSGEPSERLVERYAHLARRLGTLEDSKSFFLRYAQQLPGRGEPWLGLGFAQSFGGDLKGAEASFLRALERNPRSVGAVTGLYNVYERGTRSRETLENVRKAVAANPDSAAHHTLLGLILLKERVAGPAEAELRRAIELDPGRDAALAGMGDLLLNTGRLDEARRTLERAIARDGSLVEVRLSLGRVYLKMNRMGEAARQMSEAARLDPRSASAHGQLGVVLMMQEQRARAQRHLERALELDPELYELRLHLAVLYHDLRRMPECEAALKEAMARRPSDPEPYRLLAGLYQETGRRQEAEAVLQRLRALGPSASPSHPNPAP
ncbi:MAG TPA: tetratricopeptide repeat protein [Candidatus Polarisedimenticolia bacterium]|nr:tetratricopeptide repeat protein [Candidatus Polarisedimenticolia bacterium]